MSAGLDILNYWSKNLFDDFYNVLLARSVFRNSRQPRTDVVVIEKSERGRVRKQRDGDYINLRFCQINTFRRIIDWAACANTSVDNCWEFAFVQYFDVVPKWNRFEWSCGQGTGMYQTFSSTWRFRWRTHSQNVFWLCHPASLRGVVHVVDVPH